MLRMPEKRILILRAVLMCCGVMRGSSVHSLLSRLLLTQNVQQLAPSPRFYAPFSTSSKAAMGAVTPWMIQQSCQDPRIFPQKRTYRALFFSAITLRWPSMSSTSYLGSPNPAHSSLRLSSENRPTQQSLGPEPWEESEMGFSNNLFLKLWSLGCVCFARLERWRRSPSVLVLLIKFKIWARWGMTFGSLRSGSGMALASWGGKKLSPASNIQSYIKLHLFVSFIVVNIKTMEGSLQIVDRFISVIAAGESTSERLKTQWQYLYKLLRGQPVALDRIDAYLGILQQQDSSKRKAQQRTRNSQTLHPEAKKYKTSVDALALLFAENEERVQAIRRSELGN